MPDGFFEDSGLFGDACIIGPLLLVEDLLLGGLQDGVEAPEDGHRDDDVAVLAPDVEVAEEVVGDSPDEVGYLAELGGPARVFSRVGSHGRSCGLALGCCASAFNLTHRAAFWCSLNSRSPVLGLRAPSGLPVLLGAGLAADLVLLRGVGAVPAAAGFPGQPASFLRFEAVVLLAFRSLTPGRLVCLSALGPLYRSNVSWALTKVCVVMRNQCTG